MRSDRRSFLQGLVVTVAVGHLAACGDDETTGEGGPSTDPADQARVYPQGLASGDPSAESLILWTRVEPDADGPVDVLLEVAEDDAFATIISSETISVSAEADHTLHAKITGLAPYTTYYFRFTAQDVRSITGRTKTAPAADADVNPRFAFASCQDYIGRYYHAYKALAAEAPVDFVLFLGDYIYETDGDPDFQLDDPNRTVVLPDGLDLEDGGAKAALTLADYRTLYKQYRSDPDLQAMHALAPFICIWDDHEFANDCWQDHATDFNELKGDEKSTDRRLAANQAWIEYQPADVAADPAGLQIYRSIRYGQHVELVLTDQRSYRDDHVIPEGAASDARPPGAPDTVPTYEEAGKVFPNSEVFTRNFVKKPAFDLLEAYVAPTLLGDAQKAWFLDKMTTSTATWKIWGNETQLVQMAIDLSSFAIPDSFKAVYYFTVDQWDGFRTERAEVLTALASTQNVVALTGDIHAFYAAEVRIDPDDMETEPVLVEYITAGISSSPVQEIAQTVVDGNAAFGALAELVPQFDTILQATSPAYRYAKSFAHGVAVVDVDGANELRVTFLNIPDVTKKDWDGVVERTSFRTVAGSNRVEAL